jgi:hypothetical protein
MQIRRLVAALALGMWITGCGEGADLEGLESSGSGELPGVGAGGIGQPSGGAGGQAEQGGGGVPADDVIVYATADMEDGTLGDLVAAGNKSNLGSNYIHIVDDPTGLLSGKVARIHYVRLDTTSSKDRNNSFDWLPPAGHAIGLGQTIYLRGRFVMPLPASGLELTGRKLFYWQTHNNATNHFVLSYEDNRIIVALYNTTTGYRAFKTIVGQGIFGTPHTVEVLVTVNSATDIADGALQVWLDGAQLVSAADVLFNDSGEKWVKFKVGQQVNVTDANQTYDEYRYWDDIVIASDRIP